MGSGVRGTVFPTVIIVNLDVHALFTRIIIGQKNLFLLTVW